MLRPFGTEYDISNAFWAGLGMAVAGLEIYNLFRPVDRFVPIVILGFGLMGLVVTRPWLIRKLRCLIQNRGLLVLCLAAAAVVALRATGPCDHFDTGYYGAETVRWILTYPVVPGLANLDAWFGINSSVFLCFAALGQGPWRNEAHHLFVGFLVVAMLFCCIPAFWRLFTGRSASASDWFRAILLIPAGEWAMTGLVVGTNTDISVAVAGLTGAIFLFDRLEQQGSDPYANANSITAAIVLGLAVVFKVSVLVYAAVAWVVLCVFVLSRTTPGEFRLARILPILGFPAILVIPWLIRGAILSGYAIFPDPQTALNVGWRDPAVTVQLWRGVVESFARF
ncbi:MAG: LIC_10190 family membrane protein, partial [Candidatus Acidiferrales bacterium]